jgi:hypothetical protein
MPRSYSVRLIALTLRVPAKWLDNLLSHHELPGIIGGRQGLERQITDDGLLAIELARALTLDLGIPLSRAVAFARSALADPVAAEKGLAVGSVVVMSFRIPDIEVRLRAQLMEAMEAIGRIPRGRPRRV